MKTKRARVSSNEGWVLLGQVRRYSDIDEGRLLLGVTEHRDGKHRPVLGNRCGECIKAYREQVLGHTVPTPKPWLGFNASR